MKVFSFNIKEISFIAIFAAFTAVIAPLAIPLPFTPVPITLGIVSIFATGMLLPPKCAFFSQTIYIFLGAIGLPIFSGYRGGLGVLIGPTGGYLWAYPIMALLISFALTKINTSTTKSLLYTKVTLLLLASLIICYLLGTIWLAFVTENTFLHSLSIAVLPFIAIDLLKIIFCIVCILPIRSIFNKLVSF